MTDTIIDLSRNTGDKILMEDALLEQLGIELLDRFLEESACILENQSMLERSQELLVDFLENLKYPEAKGKNN